MAKDDIGRLLDYLGDELLKYDKLNPANAAPQPQTPPAGRTQTTTTPSGLTRLLSAVQESINKFGCSWSFEFTSGPVKSTWSGCNK